MATGNHDDLAGRECLEKRCILAEDVGGRAPCLQGRRADILALLADDMMQKQAKERL